MWYTINVRYRSILHRFFKEEGVFITMLCPKLLRHCFVEKAPILFFGLGRGAVEKGWKEP
jgi:hypothetical protein